MSRTAVAKSRADKAGKTASAPTPAITHEIVPGKFTDQDWNLLLDQDDGCDLAVDLMEEVCSSAMDIIYKQYLDSQLIPFTVLQAKDALLQVIEWQFLARDEGETDPTSQPGWMEDEEPAPATTDCWAQGVVPRRLTTPHSARSEPRDSRLEPVPEDSETSADIKDDVDELKEEQVDVDKKAQEEDQGEEVTQKEGDDEETLNVEESSLPGEETSIKEEAKSKTSAKGKSAKRKKKFVPYSGKLSSEHLTKLTESLDETEMKMLYEAAPAPTVPTPDPVLLQMPSSCHSMLKLQAGRPPGNRDVVLDDSGNVIAVPRINPGRLPSHKVRTGFQVVDPEVEAAQARLEAMRTGRYSVSKRQKSLTTGTGGPRIKQESLKAAPGEVKTQVSSQHVSKHKDGFTPLPPPLLENIEVSPGVVVREGDRVKHGPRQHPRRAELILAANQKDLRPVAVRATMPLVTVQQLLESQSPTVRPLSQSPPIPPIVPHPPSQAVSSR